MTKKIEAALELSKAATLNLRKSRREYTAALKSYTNLAAKLDSAEQYLLECSEKATKALVEANKAAKAIESSASVRAPKVPKTTSAKVKPVAANTPSGKSTVGTKSVKPKAPATGVTTDKPKLTRAESRRIAREAKALAAQQAGDVKAVTPKSTRPKKTAENQAAARSERLANK